MLNWEFGFPADLFLHDTKYINPKQVLSFYQLSEQSQQVKSDSVSLSCYDLENFLSCIDSPSKLKTKPRKCTK